MTGVFIVSATNYFTHDYTSETRDHTSKTIVLGHLRMIEQRVNVVPSLPPALVLYGLKGKFIIEDFVRGRV